MNIACCFWENDLQRTWHPLSSLPQIDRPLGVHPFVFPEVLPSDLKWTEPQRVPLSPFLCLEIWILIHLPFCMLCLCVVLFWSLTLFFHGPLVWNLSLSLYLSLVFCV